MVIDGLEELFVSFEISDYFIWSAAVVSHSPSHAHVQYKHTTQTTDKHINIIQNIKLC